MASFVSTFPSSRLTKSTALPNYIREMTDRLNTAYSDMIIEKLVALPSLWRGHCVSVKSVMIGSKDLDPYDRDLKDYRLCALDHFLWPAEDVNKTFMADGFWKDFFTRNGAYHAWALNVDRFPPEEQEEAQDQFRTAWQNAKKAQKAVELLRMFFENLE